MYSLPLLNCGECSATKNRTRGPRDALAQVPRAADRGAAHAHEVGAHGAAAAPGGARARGGAPPQPVRAGTVLQRSVFRVLHWLGSFQGVLTCSNLFRVFSRAVLLENSVFLDGPLPVNSTYTMWLCCVRRLHALGDASLCVRRRAARGTRARALRSRGRTR